MEKLDTPTVVAERPAKPIYHPLPDDVKAAIEFLLTTAQKNGMVVAGFAFGTTPPRVSNFGNCSDAGDLRLYVTLCDFSDKQKRSGHVITERVAGVVQ